MATIRNRGSYQWEAQIRRKGYPTQSKTFEIKADAEMWARSIENEMDRGVFISRAEAESTTMHEALERYGKEVSIHKKGYKREINRIKKLQEHSLGKRFLANIRSKDIAEFRDERMAEGISPSTYQKDHALISHLFTTARKEWGMEGLLNPAAGIREPKIQNGRDRRLNHGEEEKLVEAAKDQYMKTAIILALETSMRRGELVDLQWGNVHLKKSYLISKNKDAEGRDATKKIELSTRAIRTLQSLPRQIDGRVLKIAEDQITWNFKQLCKKLEIEGLRFHDLRHEATSRFFERGLSTEEVMAMTGHKTYLMLARYTHLQGKGVREKLG